MLSEDLLTEEGEQEFQDLMLKWRLRGKEPMIDSEKDRLLSHLVIRNALLEESIDEIVGAPGCGCC